MNKNKVTEMRKLFYHGLDYLRGDLSKAVRRMINIINSGGIKLRSEARGIDDNMLTHICLYRKNTNFDYNAPNSLLKSARGGWIDNCMVFVISDDVKATYIPPNIELEGFGLKTDLVDEWRCLENISLDKIIGIALPLNLIQKTLKGKDPLSDENEIMELKKAIIELEKICDRLEFKIFNSQNKNFTDIIDEQYSNSHLSRGRNGEISLEAALKVALDRGTTLSDVVGIRDSKIDEKAEQNIELA